MTNHKEIQRIEAMLRRWFEREVQVASADGESYIAVSSTYIFERFITTDAKPSLEIVNISDLARALVDELETWQPFAPGARVMA